MRMHAFQDDSKAIVSISQTFDAAFHIFVSSFHFACNCNNMSDFAHSKNTYMAYCICWVLLLVLEVLVLVQLSSLKSPVQLLRTIFYAQNNYPHNFTWTHTHTLCFSHFQQIYTPQIRSTQCVQMVECKRCPEFCQSVKSFPQLCAKCECVRVVCTHCLYLRCSSFLECWHNWRIRN